MVDAARLMMIALLAAASVTLGTPASASTIAQAYAQTEPFNVAPSVTVGVQRLRASADAAGVPIYFIAGGPGLSGLEELERRPQFFARLQSLGEVVIVEQRGSGTARPASDCTVRWNLPLDRALTHQEQVLHARERFAACAAELRRRGTDHSQISQWRTSLYAQDLLAVMRSLKHDRVRLFAHSYGTMIALELLRLDSQRVERAVLAGVMGPGDALRDPAHHERVLSTVAESLNLGASDLRALAVIALDAVEREPLRVRATNQQYIVLGRDDIARAIVQSMGRPNEIAALPSLLESLAKGIASNRHAAWLQSAADSAMQQRTGPLHRRSAAQHYVTACMGAMSTGRKLHQGLFGQVLHSVLPDACDGFALEKPPAPQPVRVQTPVMMISAMLDVRTPHEQAKHAAAHLPNSVIITLHNAGHGELLTDDSRLVELTKRFLQSESVRATSLSLPLAMPAAE
jgi:pimeloyl-ACP methyl ester carboxylesterase